MRTLSLRSTAAPLLLAAALLSGCSAPDEAALASGDAALAGQNTAGGLAPVPARAVMIGSAGSDRPGCASTARPRGDAVNLRWSANAASPAKAQLTGDAFVCERDGAWAGLVFPAHGQSADDCNVTATQRRPREYQGPCRWGWAATAELTIEAI